MKEQLVSFKTAKLAKEKGFILESKIYSQLVDQNNEYYWNNPQFGKTPSDYSKEYCITYTQSLLQKWLREKHDIHLSAFPVVKNRYYFTISKIKEDGIDAIIKGPYDPKTACDTYEQALEKGLIEALNKI